MQKHPLSSYVIAMIIVLVAVNVIVWLVGGEMKAKSFTVFSAGFLLGMLAMYIAVHLYSWK